MARRKISLPESRVAALLKQHISGNEHAAAGGGIQQQGAIGRQTGEAPADQFAGQPDL
jgi:hypothetical protein